MITTVMDDYNRYGVNPGKITLIETRFYTRNVCTDASGLSKILANIRNHATLDKLFDYSSTKKATFDELLEMELKKMEFLRACKEYKEVQERSEEINKTKESKASPMKLKHPTKGRNSNKPRGSMKTRNWKLKSKILIRNTVKASNEWNGMESTSLLNRSTGGAVTFSTRLHLANFQNYQEYPRKAFNETLGYGFKGKKEFKENQRNQ